MQVVVKRSVRHGAADRMYRERNDSACAGNTGATKRKKARAATRYGDLW